jgi:hypothetical protein
MEISQTISNVYYCVIKILFRPRFERHCPQGETRDLPVWVQLSRMKVNMVILQRDDDDRRDYPRNRWGQFGGHHTRSELPPPTPN